jgi:hypothetical protein
MEPTDLTIEILRGIHDETRKTNERVDVLTIALAEGLERVARRQTEAEVRLATEVVGVAGAVREVRDLLREDRALRNRVDDHERRIVAIEKHAG